MALESLNPHEKTVRKSTADFFRISEVDLDYAYLHFMSIGKLEMDLCDLAITGGDVTFYYIFLLDFAGGGRHTNNFQETIAKTLEKKEPHWLYDILVVTKNNKGKSL